jgi:hypothetical protein
LSTLRAKHIEYVLRKSGSSNRTSAVSTVRAIAYWSSAWRRRECPSRVGATALLEPGLIVNAGREPDDQQGLGGNPYQKVSRDPIWLLPAEAMLIKRIIALAKKAGRAMRRPELVERGVAWPSFAKASAWQFSIASRSKIGASAGSRTRIDGFGGHYTIHCATLAVAPWAKREALGPWPRIQAVLERPSAAC